MPPLGPGGQLPPGYVWAYQPPSEPEKPWRAPRWLVVISIVWAIGLIASGAVYALRGKSTVRGQTTIASAQPTVDQAIGNVVRAAGTGPAVVVGPFARAASCHITPVRQGQEYVRTVDIYTPLGTESALLKAIANGLPPAYRARSGPGNVLDLFADAGNYVGLIGSAPESSQIEIRAETGCREPGSIAGPVAAPALGAAEMTPVRTVLSALGATATSTSAAQVACGGSGGVLRTVSAHVPAGHVVNALNATLLALAPHPIAATANLFAYRSGPVDVVATKDLSGVTVSATGRCR